MSDHDNRLLSSLQPLCYVLRSVLRDQQHRPAKHLVRFLSVLNGFKGNQYYLSRHHEDVECIAVLLDRLNAFDVDCLLVEGGPD